MIGIQSASSVFYRQKIIHSMAEISTKMIQQAIQNPKSWLTCQQLHPDQSCNEKMLRQFVATCKSLYKMYLIVHLVPFLIFKRKKFMRKPVEEVKKLVKGFINSMLFAGGFTLIVRRTICLITQYHGYGSYNGAIGAFLGGITLAFEPMGRQSQIALFCLNKSLETVYNMGIRRKMTVRIPKGQILLVGLAISVISYIFRECPQAIRQNYFNIINKILGDI